MLFNHFLNCLNTCYGELMNSLRDGGSFGIAMHVEGGAMDVQSNHTHT